MKTSPEWTIGCNVEGSTLDGVTIEGVDGARNRSIARASDESQTLRDRVDVLDDRDGVTKIAFAPDGQGLDLHQLVALVGAREALLGAFMVAEARPIVRELRKKLEAAHNQRAPNLPPVGEAQALRS